MTRPAAFLRRPLWFWVGMLINTGMATAQSTTLTEPVVLRAPLSKLIDFQAQTSIFVDLSRTMSWEEVLDSIDERTLVPVDSVPDFGRFNQGRYAYWQYFELRTSESFPPQLVYYRTAGKDSITLYQFTGGELIETVHNGYAVDRSQDQHPFSEAYRFAIPIRLRPGIHYRFLVRLSNEPSFSRNITAELYPENYELGRQSKNTFRAFFLIGGIFTVVLFMGVFYLLQYFQNREKSYLFYSLYLFSLLLFYLRGFGQNNPAFGVFPIELYDYWYYQLLIFITYICYLFFVIYFLETKRRIPALHRLIRIFMVSIIVIFAIDRSLHLIDVQWAWQFSVWGRSIVHLLTVLMLVYLLRFRDKLAFFVLMGVSFLLIGMIITQFFSFDKTRVVGFFNTADVPAMIGVLLEVLFFALGLGYKSRLTEMEKQETQKQLLLKARETEHLQELDQFKSDFYTNITHEFRTPLTVILGMADELEQHPQKKPREKLRLIRQNGRQLLNLINQILDLSKLQAGKDELELQQDDIISFVRYLVESHMSFAETRELELQFRSEETALFMDFDPEKLQRIVSNLLSNAIKFTPEGGRIEVVAHQQSASGTPYFSLSIRDTGIGIAPEQLPHIFERFYRIQPAGGEKGTGIGLALVRELTEHLNGEISVESTPEQGTVFHLRFPITREAPLVKKGRLTFPDPAGKEQAKVRKAKPTQPQDADTPILLLIEDNPDITYYLQDLLEDHYQLISCNNGRAGLERALELIPDIIISDVMMPEMDGFAVCQQLKTDERTSHIPIILLTAKATADDKLTGLQYGADAYLTKPFNKAELMVRLEKLREIRENIRKKYAQSLADTTSDTTADPSLEDTFLRKAERAVLDNIGNENFSSNELAEALFLSRSQAHRKIKALTGYPLGLYLRRIRMEKAKNLLSQSEELSISEVAYRVGFRSPVYFSQIFKETFGSSPSDWQTNGSPH